MALSPGTLLGPYSVLAKLGAGGMGEVYRARDRRLERDVAIKVLPESMARDSQALGRFQREARVVAALSHPNILTIFDIGTHDELTYAVMELLEGQTLRERIKQSVLDLPEVLSIVSAVADGLSAAHAKGIVHRDIKPDNIFLTLGGTVKILDFGLAREQHQDVLATISGAPTVETQPGVLMGTITYMSPEQVRGQQADLRSDVFAFGCVLFELLAGRRPFERATSADTMAAILHDPPPTLSASGKNRPADLDRIVLRCLEKEPGARYPSARELAGAVKQIALQVAAAAATQSELDTAGGRPRPAPRTAPSVAVLPFVNMSSDAENEFFSDGLAEELISSLSKVEGLHVASRTSSFAFKGKNENIRKIGEELKVKTVLEGSVRKSGTRLRIAAQLVNVGDGYQLWSETFNRQMEDVFAIQDEIAQSITKALKGILTDKDRQVLGKTAAEDVRAYEYYLRGRQFFHEFRHKSFDYARKMFAQAIDIDPNYARAHAGLADCFSFLFAYWDPRSELLAEAEAASQRALQLDPNSAEAHVSRGFALSLQKKYTDARTEFETAIRLDPNLYEAYFFFARACMSEGRREEAAALYEKALGVRPDDYQPACLRGSIYFGLGRNDEAMAASRQALSIVQKHVELHPDDARALYLGAIVHSRMGDNRRALEWADRAVAIDPEETLTLYNVACLYSVLGRCDQALDCLEQAVKVGYANWRWIENDADFDSIRTSPRYQTLLEKLKEAYP
jgi:serine/threonine protein kinase/tetratricopeptide (TPR) repeat protein